MTGITKEGNGVYLSNGIIKKAASKDVAAREKTMAYKILRAHDKNEDDTGKLKIKFDSMISHDITYVGIIQTARASGMKEFPIPYAMTNCHNSLCAVGGTINQDDHVFGLSAAKKYGGIYVPANQAVIHQFAREKLAGCGKMILGSDSHTRYGCYGTMAVGEGGGELAKQLLNNTYDIEAPEVVLVWVTGKVPHGIGPHDVALALVGETFPEGFVKNKVLEFAGPGIKDLSMDFRIGVDVMTTETSCLSSIWVTDSKVEDYFKNVGRPEEYKELKPDNGAYYDSIVTINLDEIESMIALPFHPSKAYTIHELQENPREIFEAIEEECNKSLDGVKIDLCRTIQDDGSIMCDQGIIVGCSGGMYDNLAHAAAILKDKSIGNGYFEMSVYPSSAPINLAITKDGTANDLIEAGVVIKPAFCGPCFGAGDTPSNNAFSIRHATRNFANREGSKPSDGQISAVALMDARSIAATAANGGRLTAATDIEYEVPDKKYEYSDKVYEKRCYFGFGKADPEASLQLGPNITDWPKMPKLKDNLIVEICASIYDEVTTTDELIPSGETSSFRSNPIRLSEFALSRRAPEYVELSKRLREFEEEAENGRASVETQNAFAKAALCSKLDVVNSKNTSIGSAIFACKPGDGSAREQAASCQKVLGGFANIAYEYATKRYRSNCINWGVIPFTIDRETAPEFKVGDRLFIPDVRDKILNGKEEFAAILFEEDGKTTDIKLFCKGLTDSEKHILAEGCLMNYYAAGLGTVK